MEVVVEHWGTVLLQEWMIFDGELETIIKRKLPSFDCILRFFLQLMFFIPSFVVANILFAENGILRACLQADIWAKYTEVTEV